MDKTINIESSNWPFDLMTANNGRKGGYEKQTPSIQREIKNTISFKTDIQRRLARTVWWCQAQHNAKQKHEDRKDQC